MYPEVPGPYANAKPGEDEPIGRTWPQPATPARVPAPPVLVVSAAAAAATSRPVAAPQPPPRFPGPPRTPLARPPSPPPPPAPVALPHAPAPSKDRLAEFAERLGLVQVVWWQIAVVSVLSCVRQPWPVLAAVSAGAAAVLALTAVHVRGHWVYELAGLRARFLLRGRRHDLPGHDQTAARALSLLGMLLPGTTAGTLETNQGTALTLSHPGGVSAILRPRGTGPVAALPGPAALLPRGDGQEHDFAVQLVCHTGTKPGTPPKVWVAVQAVRTAGTPADDELALALRNGLRRVRRALERAGVPTEPLAEDAALGAVAALAHVTGGRDELREEWGFWRAGPVSQACFTLEGWSRLTGDQAARLTADLLTRTPGVAVTVTRHARPTPGGIRSGAVLRLAATTESAVDVAAAHLTHLLTRAGIRPARLDGDHLHGVAASLPIGGSLT